MFFPTSLPFNAPKANPTIVNQVRKQLNEKLVEQLKEQLKAKEASRTLFERLRMCKKWCKQFSCASNPKVQSRRINFLSFFKFLFSANIQDMKYMSVVLYMLCSIMSIMITLM